MSEFKLIKKETIFSVFVDPHLLWMKIDANREIIRNNKISTIGKLPSGLFREISKYNMVFI